MHVLGLSSAVQARWAEEVRLAGAAEILEADFKPFSSTELHADLSSSRI